MTETKTETKTEAAGERVHDPIHRVSYAFRNEGDRLWVYTWLQDGGNLQLNTGVMGERKNCQVF